MGSARTCAPWKQRSHASSGMVESAQLLDAPHVRRDEIYPCLDEQKSGCAVAAYRAFP